MPASSITRQQIDHHRNSPNSSPIGLRNTSTEEIYLQTRPTSYTSADEHYYGVGMNDAHQGFNGVFKPEYAAVLPHHNSKVLKQICEETGYAIFQENGQRKFCSPSVDPQFKLDKGSEVFIGKIPRDCFEDELIPIFNEIGKIFELRLMMDFSGTTRGFGFVSYFNPEDAQKAVAKLNNFEIRPGKKIGVCLSIDNCRLFIGGIPKSKTKSEIKEEMSKITENVVDVIVYPSVTDKMKNRGFAFVEYETHRDAAMARRRLIPGKINLWGNAVAVDWAEPELEVPKDVMQNVKILYVRNLMLSTSEIYLRDCFAEAAGCSLDDIERVKKIKDFAFVHFSSRKFALKAIETLDGTKIDGSLVEVTLAKPVDKTSHYYNKISRINNLNKLPPSMRYFNQLYHQHNIFPQGPPLPHLNPFMATAQQSLKHINLASQMHIPPNRFQYNDSLAFNSGSTPNIASEDLMKPDDSLNAKSLPEFSCVQLLEDICLANNWGIPTYDMNICSNENGVLYAFQVEVPHLAKHFSPELLYSVGCDEKGCFAPKDYIAGLEESKEMCAGRIISHLDVLSQHQASVADSAQEGPQMSHGVFMPVATVPPEVNEPLSTQCLLNSLPGFSTVPGCDAGSSEITSTNVLTGASPSTYSACSDSYDPHESSNCDVQQNYDDYDDAAAAADNSCNND